MRGVLCKLQCLNIWSPAVRTLGVPLANVWLVGDGPESDIPSGFLKCSAPGALECERQAVSSSHHTIPTMIDWTL